MNPSWSCLLSIGFHGLLLLGAALVAIEYDDVFDSGRPAFACEMRGSTVLFDSVQFPDQSLRKRPSPDLPFSVDSSGSSSLIADWRFYSGPPDPCSIGRCGPSAGSLIGAGIVNGTENYNSRGRDSRLRRNAASKHNLTVVGSFLMPTRWEPSCICSTCRCGIRCASCWDD